MAVTGGGSLAEIADIVFPESSASHGHLKSPAVSSSVTVHDEGSLSDAVADADALRAVTQQLQAAARARRRFPAIRAARHVLACHSRPVGSAARKGLPNAYGDRGRKRMDPRKAALVQRRHESYQLQAAMPARKNRSALQSIAIRQQADNCLRQTATKTSVETVLQVHEAQQQARKQALHSEWTKQVYEPITRRLRAAVDARTGPVRSKQRRQAFQEFLDFSATAGRLYLDDAGGREGDYDPMSLNRTALRVRNVPVTDDPIQRGLIKGTAEGNILFAAKCNSGAAMASQAIHARGFRVMSHTWTVHKAQPRRLVRGLSNRPSRADQDHFVVDNTNKAADADLPRQGRRPIQQPPTDPISHHVLPVVDPTDADAASDAWALPASAVRKCN